MNFLMVYRIIQDKYLKHKSFQDMSENGSIEDSCSNGKESEENHPSFFRECDEADDLLPHQLSGDEASQKSVLASQDVEKQKANFFLSITIIMKTVIGAGMLSLPLTISRLGYVLALIVFSIVVGLTHLSSIFLLKAKNLSKHSNFSTIFYHIFRSKIPQAICSSMILFGNLGVCIVELIIFKGSLKLILDSYIESEQIKNQFYTSQTFIVLVMALCETPMTFIKKIEKLRLFGFMGVSGIIVFVGTFIITFISEMPERNWQCSEQMVAFQTNSFEIASVIPNILLAFSYQMNFFPVFKGLKGSNDYKMLKTSFLGILGCATLYLIVGNLGYCLYGREVEGNFLLVFHRGDISEPLFILLNLSFLISVFFSFPFMFFGARNNFIALVKMSIMIYNNNRQEYKTISKDNLVEISSYLKVSNEHQRKRKAKVMFYIYTFILFAISVSIAITVQKIENVINVLGAITSNCISFIFPSLFYFSLVHKKKKEKTHYFHLAMGKFVFFVPAGAFAVVSQFIE